MEKESKTLTPRDYKNAILVQDACNLSGVVHSFSQAMTKIWATLEAEGRASTNAANSHPIAVLYASKIASLTGCSNLGYFTEAYNACHRMAESRELSDED